MPALMIPTARYSQSLERGLAILKCFTPDKPVLGIADVADELEMSRSTTHRYMATLVALGYLEQSPSSRKYRLGLRVTDLGMTVLNSTGLLEHSRPYLKELRERTSYNVELAVLDGLEILYVDRARSFRRGASKINMGWGPGSRQPAYCTAMGKLLLAYLPEHEQRNLIAEMRLTKYGPNTITSKKSLHEELERIRRDGQAVSDQEFGPSLLSIAAPVRDASGDVCAALGIAALCSMVSVSKLFDQTAIDLATSANEFSRTLACRQSDGQAVQS